MIISRINPIITFILICGVILSFASSIFFLQLFTGILFVLWLIEKNSEKLKSFNVFFVFVVIYFLFRLLSMIFSEFPVISIESLYKELFFYLSFLSLLFYVKSLDQNNLLRLLDFFLLASSLVALSGFILFILGKFDRAQSFSSGYSIFSAYLLTAFTFFLFYNKGNLKKIFKDIALTILLIGIVTSLGRTNIAAAVFFLILALAFKRIKFSSAVLIVVLTSIISLASFQINTKEFEGRVKNPAGLSDRDILYKGAKQIAFVHPVLGFGPKTFKEIFPLKSEFSDKGIGGWHNELLEIYFESGLLGLFAYLLMVLYPLFFSIRWLVKNKEDGVNYNIAFGASAAILALLFSSLTSGFITNIVMAIVFSFYLVLLSTAFVNNPALEIRSFFYINIKSNKEH